MSVFKIDFVNWLEKKFIKNKLYGEPQIKLRFLINEQGNKCSTLRCNEADIDERIYKKSGDC